MITFSIKWPGADAPREILLVRHGQTDFNKQRAIQGWIDTFLNSTGMKQANEMADRLKANCFDLIFTSPLKRAWQTAWVINQKHGKDVITSKLLRERNFGLLSGYKVQTENKLVPRPILTKEYNDLQGWSDDLGLETQEQFLKRVRKFYFQEFVKYPIKDKVVLIVTHSGVIYASLRVFKIKLPEGFRPENGQVIRLRVGGE
ncbi:MAG: histidine phosphatase family protein [bacterium]|nr:histidine phosphatase family protein [bacterium]